ncbi:uncharacterized protein LOC128964737 [Oppia nitens]|uniref:uncharacterized protein LOC128964737 n=1 Tax=Oppia nitens TaxID=1686743 RepID=UPI0023DA6CFD|nr:uncharacterized protein LOC128964737 [Oppia nitens]
MSSQMLISSNFLSIDPTLNQTKYLNIDCDFTHIGGGGCPLRESYCSYHICVCKPDFPININDIKCIDKYKNVGDICFIDAECENNSVCVKTVDNYNLKRCVCRPGFSFSFLNNSCIRGHINSLCSFNNDCTGGHTVCLQSKCQCNYGYEYYSTDEQCYRRAKHGESCKSTANCRVYDKLSDCEKVKKVCVCRQSLDSHINAFDQLTQKCKVCPPERFNSTAKVCVPELFEKEYHTGDNRVLNRNSLQYVYILLSVSPFVVFAIIGFLYKFINPRSPPINSIDNNNRENGIRNVYSDDAVECHMNTNSRIDTNPSVGSNEVPHPIVCQPISPLLLLLPPRDPPPTYEASQQMPPSYEEAIASQPTITINTINT